MTLQITKMLLPSNKYSLKCPNAMTPIGVTIHETGNIATAMSEISYMIGNDTSTSYHFAVDDARAVQGLPLNRNGFHAGDGRNGRGNARTIGVEHCYNWNGKATTKNDSKYNPLFQKALSNGIELVAQLFIQYPAWGVPEAGRNIWRHYDQSGKNCPQRMIQEGYWTTYVSRVKARYLELKGGKSVSTPEKSTGSHTVVSGDTLYSIAKKYNTDVQTIKSINNLKSDTIHVGNKLSIAGTIKPTPVVQPTPKPVPVVTEPQPTGNATVKSIQKTVGVAEDGWDGPNTRKGVVKLFQRYFGANDDGYIGNETLNKSKTIRSGDKGWHVYAVQAMLYLKGYTSVGTPDQKFGPASVQATKNFQKDNSLGVDGTPGKQTFAKLLKL